MKELKNNQILLEISKDKKSVTVSLGQFTPITFDCCPKTAVKHLGHFIDGYFKKTGLDSLNEWEPGECYGDGYVDCKQLCMTTFVNLWDTEVKQLAKACVAEPRLIQLMCKNDSYERTDEEEKYLKEMYNKYKDIMGMYYISDMIWRVEHALADEKLSVARLAIQEVYTVLKQPSYFQDVFNGNEDNEEWKTIVALRDGLRKILNA